MSLLKKLGGPFQTAMVVATIYSAVDACVPRKEQETYGAFGKRIAQDVRKDLESDKYGRGTSIELHKITPRDTMEFWKGMHAALPDYDLRIKHKTGETWDIYINKLR